MRYKAGLLESTPPRADFSACRVPVPYPNKVRRQRATWNGFSQRGTSA